MVNHAIKLTGSYLSVGAENANRPNILQFKEQSFIESLLSSLRTKQGRDNLNEKIVSAPFGETLRLYQPVHRLFNVLLLDVNCATYGEPRLDESKIHSSGYVLRKVDDDNNEIEYAWIKQNGKRLGWTKLDSIKAQIENTKKNYDVDPQLRQMRQLGSNKQTLLKLAENAASLYDYEEISESLFLTPPEIMSDAKKTYLYGVLNLASSEWSETDSASSPLPVDTDYIESQLPVLLTQGGNERFNTSVIKPSSDVYINVNHADHAHFKELINTLKYLANEVGLFVENNETEELKSILESIPVTVNGELPYIIDNYYTFLLSAYNVFFGFPDNEDGSSNTLEETKSPTTWPEISNEIYQSIVNAVQTIMQSRWNKLKPASPKFEGKSKYRVYAYVRMQGDEGCSLKTIWSKSSEDFEIIPWYETSDEIPPTQIDLPDVNVKTLSKLKPNVAFKVPESIQKFMNKLNLKNLMDEKKIDPPLDIGFGMICGFSIPLITICAFIVLQIFLILLNFIFWWLPFIKICIPFPKPK